MKTQFRQQTYVSVPENNAIYLVSTVGDAITSSNDPIRYGPHQAKYETMVFLCHPKNRADEEPKVASWLDLYCERSDTETEATNNHANICLMVLSGEIK